MGMKVVNLKMDRETRTSLVGFKPKAMTASEWVRLQIEVLVSWPGSSLAQAALKEGAESENRGGGTSLKAGPYEQPFRIRADHWAVLETMAQAAGVSRHLYLRRLLWAAGIFRGWYTDYLKERAEYAD